MSVDGASANAVQPLELPRSPEIVALDPQVESAQWNDQCDKNRRGIRNDDQCEESYESRIVSGRSNGGRSGMGPDFRWRKIAPKHDPPIWASTSRHGRNSRFLCLVAAEVSLPLAALTNNMLKVRLIEELALSTRGADVWTTTYASTSSMR